MQQQTSFTILLLLLISGLCNSALAHEDKNRAPIDVSDKQAIVALHQHAIDSLLHSELVIECIKNHAQSNLQLADLLTINSQWPRQPQVVKAVLENPCAQRFKQLVNQSDLKIVEILLTDSLGGLIAATPMPSDFWQADEEKFIEPVVTKSQFVSDEDWDASTATYSFFIANPLIVEGKLEAVLVTGINVTAEYLNKLSMEELLYIKVKPADGETDSQSQ
ncbi:hypothetical protein [Neptunicella marina]|uniref:Uncharacterized protein n=1 Tax=Neptunicella marina TaxID=2125989 RepID=A0A8J6ITJ7_9ALTE|nr:hypothetical protein [Neptunicella marina]MBC3765348.1 hypothetical protein [Neptunicella marina]